MTYLVGRGDLMAPSRGGVIKRYPWVDNVSRIILLAGNNRGWSMHPRPRKLLWRFYLMFRCLWWMWVIGLGRLIFSYRRGQPFVENLRIQWLRRERESAIPPTIQLYGEEEDLVAREDMLDQQYCKNFILIDVPRTGHSNAANFHEPGIGPLRRDRFVRALLAPIAELRQQSRFIRREKGEPEALGTRAGEVTDVVFVIHGIRDYGAWTHQLRQRIDQLARAHNRNIVVITPAYTRFPMLGFLLGPARRGKVSWFVNEYTTALAAFPSARFHFIGHSNGTYLLASALERYEMMIVDRVAFAGSVVRRDYPWDRLVQQERVERVRNVRAVDDLVVAMFPRFFELVREVTGISLADVGGAGVFGFHDNAGQIHEVMLPGGHGAAIAGENHHWLVPFVLEPDATPPPDARRIPARTQWLAAFSWVLWLILAACPLLLAFGLTYLWYTQVQPGVAFTDWFGALSFPWVPVLLPFLAVGVGVWWLLETV